MWPLDSPTSEGAFCTCLSQHICELLSVLCETQADPSMMAWLHQWAREELQMSSALFLYGLSYELVLHYIPITKLQK